MQIVDAVEDRIQETHRIVSVADLRRDFGSGGERLAHELIREGVLVPLYAGNGLPTLVAPRYMFEEALRAQRKPVWLSRFSLPGRAELQEQLSLSRQRLAELDTFERLLYATGEPLEEAVAAALRLLGFEGVEVTRRPDLCDVRFKYGEIQYLAEAKVKGGQASKEDVLQLTGWLTQEVAAGAEPSALRGVLIVNHFRHLPPEERAQPATAEATRLLKMNRLGLWTTADLYTRASQVLSGLGPASDRHSRELVAAEYLVVS